MNQCCPYCKALFFDNERNTKGLYMDCCQNGTIILPRLEQPTQLMQELFHGVTDRSKFFLNSPRYFNTQLSFASITMTEGNK